MSFSNTLFTASIASGSNGNCYYIGNAHEAVLVDVGISCRELERRMSRMGLHIQRVKAIFISHEHTDHIRGLTIVANKYQIPIFLTEDTLRACRLAIPPRLVYRLVPEQPVRVGDLEVLSFRKYHDAADPQSFLVRYELGTVGIFTDIGHVCEKLAYYFTQCDIAYLETNYDEHLLENGRYPFHLKRRIRGGYGHLSNRQALDLFRAFRSPNLRLLILSHLSGDNNHPDLPRTLFEPFRGETEIVVARREVESAVYTYSFPANLSRLSKLIS